MLYIKLLTIRILKIRFFNKKKGTIIIGSPISGKTTLAMQVGYFIHYNGIKLFLTDLNQGKANYLSKIIGKQNALFNCRKFYR